MVETCYNLNDSKVSTIISSNLTLFTLNWQYNPHYVLGGPPSPPHLCYKYTKPSPDDTEFLLRPHLKNFVDRVIALYQKDTRYEEVLQRPLIVNLVPGLYPLTVYYKVIWAQTI